jgi:hypothetical protein
MECRHGVLDITRRKENTKIPSVKPTHVNKMKGEKKIKLTP